MWGKIITEIWVKSVKKSGILAYNIGKYTSG